MTTYTLIITGVDGLQSSTVSDFPNDEAAIQEASRQLADSRPTVAVARGAGAAIASLGAWELEDGQANWWSET